MPNETGGLSGGNSSLGGLSNLLGTMNQSGLQQQQEQSMEDTFLATRRLGLLQSRFKIPRHLTFRERTVLEKRAEEQQALLAQGDNANAVTIGALDDFEQRLSKVKKRSTAITLKDVIAAQKPVDEPLTLNL